MCCTYLPLKNLLTLVESGASQQPTAGLGGPTLQPPPYRAIGYSYYPYRIYVF